MDDIKNKELEVFSINGTAIEIIKDNETVISGHGGDGRIYTEAPGDIRGYTSGISIQSGTIKKTTLWMIDSAERELYFTFSCELQVRKGHKITLICVRNKNTKSTVVSKILNHTTNTETTFISTSALPLDFGYGHTIPKPSYNLNVIKNIFIIAIVSFIIQGLLPEPTIVSFVAWVIITAIPLIIYRSIEHSKWKKSDRSIANKNAEIDAQYKKICSDLENLIQQSVTSSLIFFNSKSTTQEKDY